MGRFCLSNLSTGAMLVFVYIFLLEGQVKGYSLDKQILDAAPNAEMFDLFHVMNGGEVKVMTELDLLMSLDQYKELHKKSSSRKKRKSVRNERYRWKDCKVYYEIADSLKQDRDIIMDAMNTWESYTCLSFQENRYRNNRIIFQDGGGCYSELGMQSKPQVLVLAQGCRTFGTITHEIGHAIGFYHEHMRPDRDEYIRINKEAIPTRYQANFLKYENDVINTYKVDYDYTSIMHYGNDGLPGSITTLDPKYQDKIGQREGLTFKDIKLANLMYKCAEVMQCPSPNRQCPHNGFVLYSFKGKRSCECWCDSGNVKDPLVLCSSIDREPEPPSPVPQPTKTPVVKLCYDVREDCEQMKAQGMCMSKMDLMMDACPKTCDFCGKGEGLCMDHEKGCPIMAASGACTDPGLEAVMTSLCPASCNKCSQPPDPCQIQRELMGPAHGGGVRVSTPFWVWILLVISVVCVGL